MGLDLPASWTAQYQEVRPRYRQFDYLQPRVRIGHTTVPTPEAYHHWVERARSPAQRLERAALAQSNWYAKGQIGCQFARVASTRPAQSGWLRAMARANGPRLIRDAARLTTGAINDPDVEMVSLLFPHLRTRSAFVDLIEALASLPPFYMDARPLVSGYRHLRLRVNVGADGDPVASWAMAFAPDADLPLTRRAPYFELAVRVKVKPEVQFHRLNRSPTDAHLADLPMSMPLDHWEHRWQSTLEKTRTVLGGEPDDRSAAKSTYSFKEHLA